MDQVQPLDLLIEAQRLLDSDGWCQGRYTDEDGRRCAVGAIRHARGSQCVEFATRWEDWMRLTRVGDEAISILHGALQASGAELIYTDDIETAITTWNDNSSRTIADVKLAFKWAIEAAKEKSETCTANA